MSPADAKGVMAVAAIDQTKWPTGPQEEFSSQGPTSDGRIKPEISGPDNVASYVYSLYGYSFKGTSASSPHVAGAAALILSNNPSFTVDQVWDTLVTSAVDLGPGGQDLAYGSGRLNLSTIFVDPASVDFGEVIVGSSVEKVITIQNIGSPSLTIDTVAAPLLPYALVSDSCSGKSLALRENCTLKVRFSPSSTGDFNGSLIISSDDPSRGMIPVPLTGKGELWVGLSSPSDQFPISPCAMSNPPLFEWYANASMTRYEMQFSWDPAFLTIPVRVKASGYASGLTSSQWKKVLKLPGSSGGTVYWRLVGTRPDGTENVSNKRCILVASPQPVGIPAIFPVSRNGLPILSWQNQCNIRFKVWFGSDVSFSRKTSLFFHVPDPNVNGGTFTNELTSDQWSKIRNLVGDQPGANVSWYVESWDGLNRYAVTETMSFVLTE